MAKKKKKNKEKKKKLNKVSVLGPESVTDLHVEKIQYLANQLTNVTTYKDIGNSFFALDQLKKEIGPVLAEKGSEYLYQVDKSFGMFGVTDLFGYRPQGTQFWNLFPNPFGIFGYLAENYWPVQVCRFAYFREILSDGYYKVGNAANFDKAQRIMDSFGISDLRPILADYLKIFGNFWLWPKNNLLGGLKDLKILLPHYLRPLMTPDGQKIMGWEYQVGFGTVQFGINEILHQVYRRSMRHYDIGNPILGSLLVDIEADIQGSMYNNMVMQKGGLYGLAVLMDNPKGPTVPGVNGLTMARQVEAELRANHSGARSGFETIVLSGAKDVKSLGSLKDMDGAFHKTSDKVAKQVAHVLGVPHEELGIVTNANQQYHAARLQDYNAVLFDKAIEEVVSVVDKFINTRLLPLMGITDVQIRACKRYNSLTRTATQSLLDLASIENFMSHDQALVEILKLPPKGGKDGSQPLRKLPNISVTSEDVPPAKPIALPADEVADLYNPEGRDDE